MSFLIFMFVLLQSTIFLPFVNGYGPRTVVPVVVEANTTSSTSVDSAAPNACFEELSPSAVVAAGAICPVPGLQYPVLSGGGQIALVGNNAGQRTAWGGSSTYTAIDPTAVIADADIIEIGQSVTGVNRESGPAGHSGPYSLVVWSETATVQAAEVEAIPPHLVEFGGLLNSLIKDTESIVINVRRSIFFFDETGQVRNAPSLLGCGSGDTIQWVATGPMRIIRIAPTKILFGGQFNFPADRTCMGGLRWMEVFRLYEIPELRTKVDDYRQFQEGARWNWDIGDGLARTFSWHGWDYLSYFAVRSQGVGPAVTNSFLLVPTDFLDLSCSFLSGRKVCAIEQQPGY